MPRGVDYVGPRAEAQANQTLAQVIDRMGQFANTVIRDIRVDQAMKYTAQNPITPEQIEAAKNGDTSQIIPQGNFSYFDQAVRKARSFELSWAVCRSWFGWLVVLIPVPVFNTIFSFAC